MLLVLLGLIAYARREERRWWAATMGPRLGAGSLTDIVTDDELTGLATRRGRRRARSAARESGGSAAAADVAALQHTQLAYANAVSDADGVERTDTGEVVELGEGIRRRRASLVER